MSKAEELAKKYCEGSSFEDACMEKPAYIAGYHQAEKDLELTYNDICEIMEIREDVLEMDSYKNLYEEILKRFLKEKRMNYDKGIST